MEQLKLCEVERAENLICPECKSEKVRIYGFGDQSVGIPFKLELYCKQCKHEWTLKLNLKNITEHRCKCK